MKILKILKNVREKLYDTDAWIQGTYALDKKGKYIHEQSEEAVCWCLVGAIYSICGYETSTSKSVEQELQKHLNSDEYHSPTDYNDSLNTKHSDVLDLLDTAIENLELSNPS